MSAKIAEAAKRAVPAGPVGDQEAESGEHENQAIENISEAVRRRVAYWPTRKHALVCPDGEPLPLPAPSRQVSGRPDGQDARRASSSLPPSSGTLRPRQSGSSSLQVWMRSSAQRLGHLSSRLAVGGAVLLGNGRILRLPHISQLLPPSQAYSRRGTLPMIVLTPRRRIPLGIVSLDHWSPRPPAASRCSNGPIWRGTALMRSTVGLRRGGVSIAVRAIFWSKTPSQQQIRGNPEQHVDAVLNPYRSGLLHDRSVLFDEQQNTCRPRFCSSTRRCRANRAPRCGGPPRCGTSIPREA